MKIRSITALEGANIFSTKPVIKMLLHLGSWTGIYTNQIDGFTDRLIKLIPSINEHFCSRRKPGGFVERLYEGTLLGHVVEHVALELMNLAGQKVIYGKTLSTDEPGVFEIVMQYEAKEGAMQAAYSAVALVKGLLEGSEISVGREIEKIKQVTGATEFGPSTAAIIKACRERDIPVIELGSGSLVQLGYGKYQRRIQASITANTSCIGVDIACDKSLTKKLLSEAGIPVPLGATAATEEEAVEVALALGLPVVIKPENGNQGKGVSLNLLTQAQVKSAFNLARQYSNKVLVEKYIYGRHFRIAVVGNKAEAVAERLPAAVQGDGSKSIRELIDDVNQDPRRGDEHELPLTKIKVDPVVLMVLSAKGYNLETVPAAGEEVYLRENANLSTGGTAIDVTDNTHPSYLVMAVRVAKIIGLDVAGIDLVTEDISKPYEGQICAVIEVNAAPGIRMHHHPSDGTARDVAGAIVDHIFPLGTPTRIPVVSVTGTNGKTTTTRLIAHILARRGLTVGMANSDGIWIGDKQILDGDTTGPASAKTILRDPEVEAAVLETARGGILRAGLGYDFADVAIVTNISEDHFGQYGIDNLEDLAHVKSLVAEAVRKHSFVILNADDPYVAKMSAHSKGKVVYFSMCGDNQTVRQHLGTGGTAVFIKRGKIIVATGNSVIRVGNIKSFPITLDGRATHNVQNLLAAVGSAWALGVSGDEIRQSLAGFYCDNHCNPGRLNIYQLNGFKVMIDYGHNAAGINETLNVAKKLNPRRLIGVVTVPGDRPDESILKVGKLAGKGFNYLFIKEDSDLRGRLPGEVSEILASGAMEVGMNRKKIKIILPETQAFEAALDFAQPGDLVVIFYEKLGPILRSLENYRQNHNWTGDMNEMIL